MKLLLATHNRDKIRELAHALLGLPIEVQSLDDLPTLPEVDETGVTLEENAYLKADSAVAHSNLLALADDTGLEVDALNGAPGVYSSRYAGIGVSYADNVQKLLRELTGVPEAERTARFRCVIALVEPGGRRATAHGVVEGRILDHARGEGGFGYDPVFLVPEVGKTFAEMSLEEKRTVSHRGRALLQARALLQDWYGWSDGSPVATGGGS